MGANVIGQLNFFITHLLQYIIFEHEYSLQNTL